MGGVEARGLRPPSGEDVRRLRADDAWRLVGAPGGEHQGQAHGRDWPGGPQESDVLGRVTVGVKRIFRQGGLSGRYLLHRCLLTPRWCRMTSGVSCTAWAGGGLQMPCAMRTRGAHEACAMTESLHCP